MLMPAEASESTQDARTGVTMGVTANALARNACSYAGSRQTFDASPRNGERLFRLSGNDPADILTGEHGRRLRYELDDRP